jgi:hypothetical protein
MWELRQSSGAPTPSSLCWWYTLAHEQTPPADLCVSAAAAQEFAEALAAAGEAASAALVAQIAREVARGAQGERRVGGGERYVWAFRRLGDALAALRANHRSDYHAYPQPQTIHEASLDRLYQRFPLTDYPRTTALLFTGMRVCDDPRLWANPRADALVSLAPAVVAPEDWERYTLCGFRQGVALVRVSASSRWLRIGARALEDAWAAARRETEGKPPSDSALKAAESLARDALLRAAPVEAIMRFDEPTIATATREPTAARPLSHPARQPQPLSRASGKRQPGAPRRPAV